jgi:two-component system chemotaxis sensor kinase CheA
MGLVLGVVLASVAIGWAITRGLTRSVRVLSLAAENVHKNHDFSIRAEKTSNDELGLLTDAFNGMLAGIQDRDRELEAHRQNLEALVDARTRELSNKNEEMTLVLDNVDQGLAMVDRKGQFLGEPSRAFKAAFGTPPPGTPFYELLVKDDDATSFRFESGYEQMIADVIPIDLALDQLPKRLVRDGRSYDVAFRAVVHAGEISGALLMTRDVTLELEAQRLEAEQRERVRIFERLMRDRAGFQEFFEEARALITRLETDQALDEATAARLLHTFKGTTAVFDVNSLSELAHELEQALAEHDRGRVALAQQRLFARWEVFRNLIGPAVGDGVARSMEVSPIDLADLIDAVRAQAPHSQLLRDLVRLTYELVARRFERMADQIKRVARRLHKPEPLVEIDAAGVRVPANRFRPFWATLAHVIRNMADHGFELEAERVEQGKPQQNHVELRARLSEQGLIIEVSDDGRGIDWARLEERARQKGLPIDTTADLVDALFADGVSTADRVTETSGRGVGMSAVRQSCQELGGTISVHSERGRGTRFRFVFPPFADGEIDTRMLSRGEPESLHPALVAI